MRLLLSNCLNWKIHSDDHSSLFDVNYHGNFKGKSQVRCSENSKSRTTLLCPITPHVANLGLIMHQADNLGPIIHQWKPFCHPDHQHGHHETIHNALLNFWLVLVCINLVPGKGGVQWDLLHLLLKRHLPYLTNKRHISRPEGSKGIGIPELVCFTPDSLK